MCPGKHRITVAATIDSLSWQFLFHCGSNPAASLAHALPRVLNDTDAIPSPRKIGCGWPIGDLLYSVQAQLINSEFDEVQHILVLDTLDILILGLELLFWHKRWNTVKADNQIIF